MNKSKISILGCGWLGLPLAIFLVKKGYHVNGSATSNQKLHILKAAGINPFHLSISDKDVDGEPESLLNGDILIVNIPPKRRTDIVDYYPAQIDLLIQKIKLSTISKVLFISTTSVYQSMNGIVDENTIPQPEKPSGIATLRAEQMLQIETSFDTTILRFAGLIGPERNPGGFLAGKENVSGADNPVNLIHLNDCIGIIHSIIENQAWGDVFNGCSPYHSTKKEYYTDATVNSGLTPPLFNETVKSDFKQVDGSKVSRVLGYTYKASINLL